MSKKRKPKGHWTKEKCKEVALEYKRRSDFQKGDGSAYKACLRNGWLDEVCSHMGWTKEKCKEVALEYKSRSDFKKGERGAYESCRKNGWLDEVCSHMGSYCDDTKKYIYALEFSSKVTYIGLSNDPHRRFKQHINTNSGECVRKYINKHDEIPTLKILCEGLSSDNAGENENHYMQIYKQNGFRLLNVAPAGSLGGQVIIWTKEKCKEVALKYKRRIDFKKENEGAYDACCRNGWLDEVCSHMEQIIKPAGYWTKDKCKEVALEYKSRGDFQKGNRGAYESCRKNGWMDEVCSHMNTKKRKPAGYWTKDKCKEVALEYKSRGDFWKENRGAYDACIRNGWLDEVCSHMKGRIKTLTF